MILFPSIFQWCLSCFCFPSRAGVPTSALAHCILICFASVSLSLFISTCLSSHHCQVIISQTQSPTISRKLNIKHHLFPSDLNVSSSQSRKAPQNFCDCFHGYHLLGNRENALLHYCIERHVGTRNILRAADKNHPSTVVLSDMTRFCQNKKYNLTVIRPCVTSGRRFSFAFSASLRMFLNQKKDRIFRVIPPDLVCVFFLLGLRSPSPISLTQFQCCVSAAPFFKDEGKWNPI